MGGCVAGLAPALDMFRPFGIQLYSLRCRFHLITDSERRASFSAQHSCARNSAAWRDCLVNLFPFSRLPAPLHATDAPRLPYRLFKRIHTHSAALFTVAAVACRAYYLCAGARWRDKRR